MRLEPIGMPEQLSVFDRPGSREIAIQPYRSLPMTPVRGQESLRPARVTASGRAG
jgi:hypothetical protein